MSASVSSIGSRRSSRQGSGSGASFARPQPQPQQPLLERVRDLPEGVRYHILSMLLKEARAFLFKANFSNLKLYMDGNAPSAKFTIKLQEHWSILITISEHGDELGVSSHVINCVLNHKNKKAAEFMFSRAEKAFWSCVWVPDDRVMAVWCSLGSQTGTLRAQLEHYISENFKESGQYHAAAGVNVGRLLLKLCRQHWLQVQRGEFYISETLKPQDQDRVLKSASVLPLASTRPEDMDSALRPKKPSMAASTGTGRTRSHATKRRNV